jgi:hypothetical protein
MKTLRVESIIQQGLEGDRKINQFFNIDAGGKFRIKKGREVQIKKFSQLIKKEKSFKLCSGAQLLIRILQTCLMRLNIAHGTEVRK